MSPYGVPMGSNGQWEPLLAELGTPKCRGNGWGSLWGLYGVQWGLYGVYMGCYEALWPPGGAVALYGVSMGIRGSLGVSVALYGSLWALGGHCGSLWGLYGSQWVAMGLHGALWGLYGVPMALSGSLWVPMGSQWAMGTAAGRARDPQVQR